MLTVADVWKIANSRLDNVGIVDYEVEAKLLLMHCFQCQWYEVVLQLHNTCDDKIVNQINELLDQRINGTPLAYLLENKCFFGYDFYVNCNVLIPRFDSEIMIVEILQYLKTYDKRKTLQIIDLGSGSGCLSLTVGNELLKKGVEIDNFQITLVDISEEALRVAKKNAQKFGLQQKCVFVHADFTADDFAFEIKKSVNYYDIVISNPPYIPTQEILSLDGQVLQEPKIALDGGFDGLKFYRFLNSLKKHIMTQESAMFLEIGYNQADQVLEIMQGGRVVRDIENRNRVIVIKN